MNKKIPFLIALAIIILVIIIASLIIILKCPGWVDKEDYFLPKEEIKDTIGLNCIEHEVLPEISPEECAELNGQMAVMAPNVCCLGEDFLGTVKGLRHQLICCKDGSVKMGNPAFIDVRLMDDWSRDKNNELGIWIKNLQEPAILSIDFVSFRKEEVLGAVPLMEYKFLFKNLPIVKRIDEDGFYKLTLSQDLFSNQEISHWEISVYLSNNITIEPTKFKSPDPVLFPIKDIFPEDLSEDHFYIISSYKTSSLINYIISPIELFYIELDKYHGLFNYISEDKVIDKSYLSLDEGLNIEPKEKEKHPLKLWAMSIYPNPINVGEKELVRIGVSLTGEGDRPEEIELIKTDKEGRYIDSLGFLKSTDGVRKYQGEIKMHSEKEESIFLKLVFVQNKIKYQSPVETFYFTDFPTGTAPFDASKLIGDPNTGEKVIKNRVIIGFKDNISPSRIREIVSSENSTIVGTILSLNVFQIEFETKGTIEEVYNLIERFNSYEEIRYAKPSYLIELDLP